MAISCAALLLEVSWLPADAVRRAPASARSLDDGSIVNVHREVYE